MPVFHNRGTMILDNALANAKVRGDIFIKMASQNEIHDLMLPLRETPNARFGVLSPSGQFARIPRMFNSILDAGQEFITPNRFFDEVQSASLHGLNSHWHVTTAGDHDFRQSSRPPAEAPMPTIGNVFESCRGSRTGRDPRLGRSRTALT